jgi:hypothetical protein
MKGVLFAGFLSLIMFSACTPASTPAPEPTNTPVVLFFGTPMPPSAPIVPSPTFAPNLDQTISIEYASVAEALVDLKTQADAAVVVREGWMMIIVGDGYTTWTFTPPDHPASPTVAKRTLYQDQDGWHIAMKVQCEAEQKACEDFIYQFSVLNNEMLKHLEPQRTP